MNRILHVVAGVLCAYLASFLLLVQPVPFPRLPNCRGFGRFLLWKGGDGEFVQRAYWPLVKLDQILRPKRWWTD